MKIVIDTNILVQLFRGNPLTRTSYFDPKTSSIIENISLRAEALVSYIASNKGVVIIPTPVLAEYLIGIDKENQVDHIRLISSKSCFEICPFDETAALECARLPTLQELKQLNPDSTANKIRFDRQIISIAKAINADEIWTHDKSIYNFCLRECIKVCSLADIDPKPEQFNINYSSENTEAERLH